MAEAEIEASLTHLAVERQVSASTQNQALNALMFLYREVLRKKLDGPIEPTHAKRPKRLPTVLTRQEALAVIDRLSDTYQLMAKLLYGSGLRLMECVRLRVKACPERSRRNPRLCPAPDRRARWKRHEGPRDDAP